MTQYLDIDDALERAKERTEGQASNADDDYMTELLEMTAGLDALLLTHYRPFYVAAKLLEQRQAAQALSKAGDVEFTNLAVPIASLLALQAAYDAANGLVLPAGFEAVAVAPEPPRRFRSVAIQRISVP